MFNLVLRTETCPSDWPKALIAMSYKQGDPADPANYRGIALVNHATKIVTHILKIRLEVWAEANGILADSQFGFRGSRGCSEAKFTLLSAIHLQLRLSKREVHAIFVDFHRAFDSVPHNRLWFKLNKLGVSSKIVRLTWNWLIRMLDSSNQFIPKICLKQQFLN